MAHRLLWLLLLMGVIALVGLLRLAWLALLTALDAQQEPRDLNRPPPRAGSSPRS